MLGCTPIRRWRFLEDGRPLDRAAALRSMAVHLGHWRLRGYGQWALEEGATGDLVGRAGLGSPRGGLDSSLGGCSQGQWWGRGFATEAGRAAIEFAFRALDSEKVISLIRPENHPSIRAAQRLGESYEDAIELAGVRAHVYSVRRSGSAI
jgi:RimJ/RimL family protein N-acetyltransferase